MDRPSRELGHDHRFLRHNPSEPLGRAVERYGVETARRVMEDHVKFDDHDFLAEMRGLLIRELAAEARDASGGRSGRMSEVYARDYEKHCE